MRTVSILNLTQRRKGVYPEHEAGQAQFGYLGKEKRQDFIGSNQTDLISVIS